MKICHPILLLSLCAIALCNVASCGKKGNAESESDAKRTDKAHESRLPAQGIGIYEMYLNNEFYDTPLTDIVDSTKVSIKYGYSRYPEFAYVLETDTAAVNAALDNAIRLGKFPSDASYAWSYHKTDRFPETEELYFALYFLKGEPALTSDDISAISKDYERENDGIPALNIRLTDDGAEAFARLTKDNIGRPLAITFNGKVLQAPTVNAAVKGGSFEVTTHSDRDTYKLFKHITRKLEMEQP